ncbi:MAG: OmpA family protein [Acidobacteriota bacterium]
MIHQWTSYRTLSFYSTTTKLSDSDKDKVSEVAEYMRQNPSLRVGIDSSIPSGSDSRNQDLAASRASNVRSALIASGVPESRIEMGAFGDPRLASEGRVEVLIRTSN